jgi:hypothetical protein
MQKEYGMQAVQKPPGYEVALEAWRRQWLPLLVFADVLIAAMRVVACLPASSLPCYHREVPLAGLYAQVQLLLKEVEGKSYEQVL